MLQNICAPEYHTFTLQNESPAIVKGWWMKQPDLTRSREWIVGCRFPHSVHHLHDVFIILG
jgi:hypothetical protein